MVKRLISADSSDMLAMNGAELKQSIKASEGRVVLSENVVLKNQATVSQLLKLLQLLEPT
jgi:hypothetical protein